MITWPTLLAAFAAYLLGSIPFGYLLYRLRRGEDIRETGSGNIGATNVLRAAGTLTAAATLLLDAGKGYLAVTLAAWLAPGSPDAAAAAALFVIVGHCYPLFLKFRGGKGVATGLGVFLAISPAAILICTVFFAISTGMLGYVSLASILAAAVLPLVLLWSGSHPPSILITAFGAAGLIIFRHRANIQRLRAGTERRIFSRRGREG